MMRTLNHRNSGFTLVEILVYLAIFLVVTTASVLLMISFSQFIDQYRIETTLYRSGTTAMEQILVSLRKAERFDSVTSTIDNPTAGLLAVERGASTTQISLVGNELQLQVDGGLLGSITGPNVSVGHFTVFQHPTLEGNLIRIRLHLTATENGVSKSMTFYGGAVIRGEV